VAATPRLVIEDGEGHRQVVPFAGDEIRVGRAPDGNPVRLVDRDVSRRHARFLHAGGVVFVEDLGSANGTRVNGERVEGRRRIREGDLIQIGEYDLAIEGGATTAEALSAVVSSTAPTAPSLPATAPPPLPVPSAAPAPAEAPPPPAAPPAPPPRMASPPAPAASRAPEPGGLARYAGTFVAIGLVSLALGWAAGWAIRRSSTARPGVEQTEQVPAARR
jgi:predicted component of type VI protein secretion system